jgi:LysM repeat protein
MKLPAPFQIKRRIPAGTPPVTGRPQKLKASTRSASRSAMDDYEDEPTMKLGTAVIVVLVLHIVAVGGVYAFNRIKAERIRNTELSTEVEMGSPGVAEGSSKNSMSRTLKGNVHQVEAGETLANIARAYGVPLESLEQANDLSENSILRIGQELRIPRKTEVAATRSEIVRTVSTQSSTPKPASSTSGPGESGEIYTVVSGDNPVAIARRFKVSYNDLMKLNQIEDPRRLQIGQKLKIPLPR